MQGFTRPFLVATAIAALWLAPVSGIAQDASSQFEKMKDQQYQATIDYRDAARAGDFAAAEIQARRVLEAQLFLHENGEYLGPYIASTYEALAWALDGLGRSEESAGYREEAKKWAAMDKPDSGMSAEEEDLINRAFDKAMAARDAYIDGDYTRSERLGREALSIKEQHHALTGAEELGIASSLHNLAAALAGQGRLGEAENMAREALRLRQQHGGVPDVLASSERLLASILQDTESFTEARALMESVVNRTLSGELRDQTNLVQDVARVAYVSALDGYVGNGIQILNQLVPMMPQMTETDRAHLLTALGRLSSMNGQPAAAEDFYRQALALSGRLETSAQWTMRHKAVAISNLASILMDQGRFNEALGLFLQADSMLVSAGDSTGSARAGTLDGLGEARRALHQYQEAYDVQRAALDIRIATLPEGSAKLGVSFSNIGLTLLQAGRFDEAVQALEKAVAIQRGYDDPIRLANAALNLSGAYGAQERFAEALAVAEEGRTALAATLPPSHPKLVGATFNQSWLHLAAGENKTAARLSSAALAQVEANSWQLGTDDTVGGGQVRDHRRQVLAEVVAQWETAGQGGMDRAFRAAQWAQASKAAQVTRRVAARFASGDGETAELARQKQDLVNQWRAVDQRYLAMLALPGADPAVVADLRAQTETLQGEINAVDDALLARAPDYARLTRPAVVGVAEIQAALAPGEAFLMPVTTPDETYLFAISPDRATWRKTQLTDRQLDALLRSLRAGLDPTGPSRSAVSLDEENSVGTEPGFDAGAAHALYQALVEPVAETLDDADTVHIVKEAALSGLPFAVLLSTPADLEQADADAFREADWLLRRHAFVTAPSAAGFAGRQSANNRTEGKDLLAGFGDPVFSGRENAPQISLAALQNRGVGDSAAIRNLAPLPGTRRELLGLAQVLGASEDSLALGLDATEGAVKSSARLQEARIAVFATHGLVAGELSGLEEPALAFTPPDMPDARDDGLLTASEVAQMRLKADWVILSACNTAAPDGTPGGEGLSGLASAFLYAGAQSLLVSHWPVRDDAAALLTQGAVTDTGAGLTKAQRLRASMLDLIENGTIRNHAHPSVWAPFVIVGAN